MYPNPEYVQMTLSDVTFKTNSLIRSTMVCPQSIEEEKVSLFEFTFSLDNYSTSPFENVTGLYFKPALWYTTR